MAEEFTAKFKVDISDLKKNIAEANHQIKLANAEFNAASAGMDDWSKSADGISKKLESLDKVLSAQKSLLDSTRQQLERQQAAYAENGKRAEQLRAAMQDLINNGVSKTSEEYKKYEKALNDVEKEQAANEKAINKLEVAVLDQEAAVGKTEKEIRSYSAQLETMESTTEGTADETQKLGKAAESAGDDIEDIKKSASEATKSLQELAQKGAAKAEKAIAALGAAFVGAVASLTSIVLSAAGAADEISDLSKVTGLSVKQLQKYQYTADQVGTSLDVITGAQTKLVKSMSSAAKGTGDTADAFKRLGVNIKGTDGTLRDADEVFLDLVDSLGAIENETERDALAMKVFGKSARELNPLILEGSKALKTYSDEAEELGIIVGDDVTGALADVSDEFKKVKAQVDAAKQNFAAQFAPVVQKVLKASQQALTKLIALSKNAKIRDAVNKLGDAFLKLVNNGLSKLEKALPKLINTATWLVDNFKTLVIVIGSLWAAFKSVAIITGVINAFKTLKTALESVRTATVAAKAATEAMNTTMEASSGASGGWIGALIAVAAALAMFAVEAVNSAKEAQQAAIDAARATGDAMKAETEQILDNISATREAYASSVSATDAAAENVLRYLDRLSELEEQTTLTNEEQDEYRQLVAKINMIMPELNAEIDEGTGLLKQSTKELKKNADELVKRAKFAALEEELTEEYKNQLKIQKQLEKAEAEVNRVNENYLKELARLRTELTEAEERSTDAKRRGDMIAANQAANDIARTKQKIKLLEEEQQAYAEAWNTANRGYQESVRATDDLIAEYDKLADELGVVEGSTDAASGAMTGLGDAMDATGEKAAKLADEHFNKVVGSVQDMFNKIDESTDLSMKKIIETLKHNSEALARYQENLRTIYERGASENVLNYLESLGVEQAGVIAMIAQSTDEEFQDFISQFDDNTEQAHRAGQEWGEWLALGVKKGMESELAALKKAAQRMARELSDSFRNTLQIASPSKVFERFGKFTGLGFILGFKRMDKQMTGASVQGATNIAGAFKRAISKLMPSIEAFKPAAGGAAWAAASTASMRGNALTGGGSTTHNVNYTQIINGPKAPSRIEIYRDTRNLLSFANGGAHV